MKLIVLLALVIFIAVISLRSVYKFFKGESGCNCSNGKKGSCAFKDKCNH